MHKEQEDEKNLGNGNKNYDVPNKPSGFFRTRKAEIISGFSVATLISLYAFARSVVSDIHGVIESQTRVFEQRIDQLDKQFTTIIELERSRNQADIQDLKQRMIYLERETKNK